MEINIAVCKSRKDLVFKNITVTWDKLIEKLKNPVRTYETVSEYEAMSKDKRADIKDVGGFVGGQLKEGRRKNGYVMARSIITLDADTACSSFLEDVYKVLIPFSYAIYSTHSHTKSNPRYRLLIPLSRAVTPDEYEAIARKIAHKVGIDNFDDTTYESTRLMFWPSVSKNGEYVLIDSRDLDAGETGSWAELDPDMILCLYNDWHDVSEWPKSSRASVLREKHASKQGDPTLKEGIIGAFCRAYGITEAIDTFLPEIYTPMSATRFTYAKGSTAGGLVIYDNKFAFSNHSTDPCAGQLCNSFDLVRIHLYGDRDLDSKEGTPNNKLPSFIKMQDLATNDANVRAQAVSDRVRSAAEDFVALGANDNTSQKPKEADKDWMAKLSITKGGILENTIKNFLMILTFDPRIKGLGGKDLFRDRYIVFRNDLPWKRDGGVWTDSDDAALRLYMESTFGLDNKAKLFDALDIYFMQNAFHPVKDYLSALKWDGEKRLERLLINYLGAEDSAYTKVVTRKTLVAAVARIFNPGCKFDYMLTLVGKQGLGKSLLVNKLGGEWFSDSMVSIQGKESYEALDGVWIMEMGELAAIKKSEREAIKMYISKQEDIYRKAYGKNVTYKKRQNIFIGTTNDTAFLNDSTGGRRFWVVDCGRTTNYTKIWNGFTNYERDQVWAEAVELYKGGEEIMKLDAEIEAAARKAQEEHADDDPYLGMLLEFLNTPIKNDWNTLDDIDRNKYYQNLRSAKANEEGVGDVIRTKACAMEFRTEFLGLSRKEVDKRETRRINECFERLGWKKLEVCKFQNYGPQRGYERPLEQDTFKVYCEFVENMKNNPGKCTEIDVLFS